MEATMIGENKKEKKGMNDSYKKTSCRSTIRIETFFLS